MKLYEIDAAIQNVLDNMAVDPETGAVTLDEEALLSLQMEREAKLEGVALSIKNMSAEAAAIKAEEDALSKRRKLLENKLERTKGFLMSALNGAKLKTSRVSVSYNPARPSCKIDDAVAVSSWALDMIQNVSGQEYSRIVSALNVRLQPPKIDANGCKKLIQEGYEIPGAHIEEGQPSLRIV